MKLTLKKLLIPKVSLKKSGREAKTINKFNQKSFEFKKMAQALPKEEETGLQAALPGSMDKKGQAVEYNYQKATQVQQTVKNFF